MIGGVITFKPSELRGLGPLPEPKGCDFCATGEPRWRYPARAVGLGWIVHGNEALRPVSIGYWQACTDCSDLIEVGDWPALARRSLRSLNLDFSQAGPGVRVRMLAEIRGAQTCFQRARTGPRVTLDLGNGQSGGRSVAN